MLCYNIVKLLFKKLGGNCYEKRRNCKKNVVGGIDDMIL